MKVKMEQIVNDFTPIKISFTMESMEEARAMYAVFNNISNTCLFDVDSPIHDTTSILGDKFSVSGEKAVISNGITYEQFYCSKRIG